MTATLGTKPCATGHQALCNRTPSPVQQYTKPRATGHQAPCNRTPSPVQQDTKPCATGHQAPCNRTPYKQTSCTYVILNNNMCIANHVGLEHVQEQQHLASDNNSGHPSINFMLFKLYIGKTKTGNSTARVA